MKDGPYRHAAFGGHPRAFESAAFDQFSTQKDRMRCKHGVELGDHCRECDQQDSRGHDEPPWAPAGVPPHAARLHAVDEIQTEAAILVVIKDGVRREFKGDEVLLVEDILNRLEVGRKDYGPWSRCNPLNYDQEEYEELLDAMVYRAMRRVRDAKKAVTL